MLVLSVLRNTSSINYANIVNTHPCITTYLSDLWFNSVMFDSGPSDLMAPSVSQINIHVLNFSSMNVNGTKFT